MFALDEEEGGVVFILGWGLFIFSFCSSPPYPPNPLSTPAGAERGALFECGAPAAELQGKAAMVFGAARSQGASSERRG